MEILVAIPESPAQKGRDASCSRARWRLSAGGRYSVQFGGELVFTVPNSTWNVLKSVRLIQPS